MPKIRRRNVPPALFAHLLDRVQQRGITATKKIKKVLEPVKGNSDTTASLGPKLEPCAA